ncbi:hypothetical protein, partial [Serratia marcescens]|uniref:hypothetical protein n=1 Tax=Serratia marcescens TaxID=615 RepID=UPI001EF8A11D
RLAQGGDWRAALEEDFRLLADSRPTAVNLFWALNRMRDRLERMKEGDQPLAVLEAEAISIHESDREANLTALYYPRGWRPAVGTATAEVVLVVCRE